MMAKFKIGNTVISKERKRSFIINDIDYSKNQYVGTLTDVIHKNCMGAYLTIAFVDQYYKLKTKPLDEQHVQDAMRYMGMLTKTDCPVVESHLYCSCNNQNLKMSEAAGKAFKYCTSCKKEIQVRHQDPTCTN